MDSVKVNPKIDPAIFTKPRRSAACQIIGLYFTLRITFPIFFRA